MTWRPIALASLASPIGFLAANQFQSPSVWRLALITMSLFVLGVLTTWFIGRSASRRADVGPSISIGIVVFTYFGLLQEPLRQWTPTRLGVLGILLTVGCSIATYLVLRSSRSGQGVILWGLVAMVIGGVVGMLGSVPKALADDIPGRDVIVVILDGYAGTRALHTYFDYDNGPFLMELRAAGFAVQEDTTASYTMTFASLASALDMRYLLEGGSLLADEVRPALSRVTQGANQFVGSLKGEGYHFVQVESGWSGTRCGKEVDTCVRAPLLDETTWNFLQRTVAGPFLTIEIGHVFAVDALSSLDHLDALTQTGTGPRLVIGHVLLPHPPFVLNEACEFSLDLDLRDMIGGNPHDRPSLAVRRKASYIGQLECANTRFLEIVSNLQASDAVVVLMGDHGTDSQGQLVTPVEDWSTEMVDERLDTILAIRGCGPDIPTHTVNALRFAASCVLGTEYQPIPYRRFLVPVSENFPDDSVLELPVTPGD